MEAIIPWRRMEPLNIDGVRYSVPSRVVAHFRTMTASLASLADTCRAQAARIAELETAAQPKSIRWTPGMKQAVVMLAKASADGRISALTTFGLSARELDSWIDGYDKHGINGLKVTRLQHFRGGRS